MNEECRGALPHLVDGARVLGLSLTLDQQERFARYCEVLREWNSHTNLTAVRTAEGMMGTLFLDSLTLAPTINSVCDDPSHLRVVDIGAGAGLPSLPLKVLFPDWSLVLVDSVGKKTRFLAAAVDALGLGAVNVHTGRAEDMARKPKYRDGFDLCVARAVSALPALLELCGPFVRVGGYLIFPKSGAVQAEVGHASVAERRLGLRLLRVDLVDPRLGIGGGRALVVYVKERPTPAGYPRRTGLAQSRPIGT
jgi:16S rRNA (guanine527-N7)-methyltransferase